MSTDGFPYPVDEPGNFAFTGDKTDANEIERLRMHLKDAADVFDVTSQRLAFLAIPGTQRSQIAKEMAWRARQFRNALAGGPGHIGEDE